MKNDSAAVIAEADSLLTSGARTAAEQTIRDGYPFVLTKKTGRNYTPFQSMNVFLRDGFIDRYSGSRLVHPAMLRLLSWRLPEVFPAQKNWKMTETHPAYWELFPTVDHLVPVARGGSDESSNWVTTSMLLNGAKSNALVEQIGWELHPVGCLGDWDGLTSRLMKHWDSDPEFDMLPADGREQHQRYILRWCRATRRALHAR